MLDMIKQHNHIHGAILRPCYLIHVSVAAAVAQNKSHYSAPLSSFPVLLHSPLTRWQGTTAVMSEKKENDKNFKKREKTRIKKERAEAEAADQARVEAEAAREDDKTENHPLNVPGVSQRATEDDSAKQSFHRPSKSLISQLPLHHTTSPLILMEHRLVQFLS